MATDIPKPADEEPGPSTDVPDAWLEHAFGRGTELVHSSFGAALEAAGMQRPTVALHDPAGEPAKQASAASRSLGATDDGRYRFLGELDRGAMGAVLRAHDVDLGRDVAVKVLHAKHLGLPQMVQRFVEEAQIGAQLQHPGIVPVYGLGLIAGERPYFAMKLVKGRTLATMLSERTSPEDGPMRFVRVFEQICQAVAFAHAHDVIHRDLKPANVMVGAFGEVQVMDWGLAKVIEHGGIADEAPSESVPETVIETVRSVRPEYSSRAGAVMGTLAYMAPEQARGEVSTLRPSADVFALGAILGEVLTGEPPYTGGSVSELHARALGADLEPAFARLEQSGAPAELIGLARRCLASDARERPVDASVLVEEVSAFLRLREERAREAEVEAEKEKAREVEAARRVKHERRARRLSVALSCLGLLAVGSGVYTWLHVEREARLRDRSATELALVALEEANLLWGEARTTAPPSEEAWVRSLDAVLRSEQLALADGVSSEARTRVQRLAGDLRHEAEAAKAGIRRARADAEMVERLHGIRLQFGEDWEWDRQAASYPRAFADHGIPVLELLPGEIASRLQESAVSGALLEGVQSWRRALDGVTERDAGVRRLQAKLDEVTALLQPDPWRESVRAACRLGDQGRLRELVTERSPGELGAQVAGWVGDRLGYAGAYQLAVSWLRDAHVAYPADFWINHQLAKFAMNLTPPDPELAIRHYSAALAIRPRSVGAWDNLGLAFRQAGRNDEAKDAFLRAIAFKPEDPIAYGNLAGIYVHVEGRWEEGIELLDQALAARPDYAKAVAYKGTAFLAKGDVDRAIDAFQRAIAMKPADARRARTYMRDVWVEAVTNLGATYLYQKQDLVEARRWYERAVAAFPERADSHYNMGVLHDAAGDPGAALASYRRAVECDPEHPEAWTNIGWILGRRGESAESVLAYRRAIEADPTNGVALSNLGNELRDEGRTDEAEELLRRAVAVEREFASEVFEPQHWRDDAWYNLGLLLLWDRGLASEAENALRKALELNAEHLLAKLDLGNALEAEGRIEDAIAVWEELRETNLEWKAEYNRGNVFVGAERWQDARLAYERVLELQEDGGAWAQLSYVHLQLGDAERARLCGEKALAVDPENVHGFFNLGTSLWNRGELQRAAEVYERAIAKAAATPRQRALLLQYLGECYEQLGLFDEARGWMQEAFRLNDQSSRTFYRMGVILDTVGEHERALRLYRQAVAVNENDVDALVDIGFALERLGRYEEAAEAYRTGHEKAQGLRSRSHDSGQWVRDAERMSEIAAELDSHLDGTRPLEEESERLLLARVCATRRPTAAVGLFEELLRASPDRAREAWRAWWLRAAICAVRAASADSSVVAGGERSRLFRKALEFLREDLSTRSVDLEGAERSELYGLLKHLRVLKAHVELAPIREPEHLVAAAPEERAECEAFWRALAASIEELVARLAETTQEEPR